MTHPPRKRTGRGYGHAIKIPDVSTQPCPAGGRHRLVNDVRGRTTCAGCLTSWADLDEAVRVARGWGAAS